MRLRREQGSRTEPDDEHLLAALATDPSSAIGELYDRYSRLVYGVAVAVLSDPQEAEDLTQEVFLGLIQRCEYDRERGSLAAYLTTMVRSRGIDRLRTRGRVLRLLTRWHEEPSRETVTHDEAVTAENVEAVRSALADLPSAQRDVLELGYYKGLSQSQIAARLGMPLGTVKTRQRQALFTLRRVLGDRID